MAKKHAAAHGGAWKVAYADFTTSMMALFIVLWLISSDQETREAVQAYFRGEEIEGATGKGKNLAPDQSRLTPFPTDAAGRTLFQRQELRRAAERLRDQLNNNDAANDDLIRFEFLADGIRIVAMDRSRKPFFEEGTSVLTEFGRWVLRTIAWELERYPFAVEVEGHTQKQDGRVDLPRSWDLSSDRAVAARAELERSGVRSTQFWRVAGYADRKPANEATPESEENRRITIIVRPDPEEDVDALLRKMEE